MNNNVHVAAAEGRYCCLISAFDEIAHTFLDASHRAFHAAPLSYLDGWVAVGDAPVTRRGVLLAIHDMKDDLEAPSALRKGAHAVLMVLKMQPAPQPKLYRDIATAVLRVEVMLRSMAVQARRNGAACV